MNLTMLPKLGGRPDHLQFSYQPNFAPTELFMKCIRHRSKPQRVAQEILSARPGNQKNKNNADLTVE